MATVRCQSEHGSCSVSNIARANFPIVHTRYDFDMNPKAIPAILPSTAAIARDGHLHVGGCDVPALAVQYGTPLFVYDEDEIRTQCRAYVDAFGAECVTYAAKAFLCQALVHVIDEEGLQLDVASEGELTVALHAGFPPARIVVHGNNKSEAELRLAFQCGVGRLVVDSFGEIERIAALVAELGTCPALLLRVTPGVEAHTHTYIDTGVEDSKFGFSIRNGDAARAYHALTAIAPSALRGLHCHIGSQITALDGYQAAIDIIASFVADTCIGDAHVIDELVLGGGLGVAYTHDDEAIEIAELARTLHASTAHAWIRHELGPLPRIGVEPGRSIVGRAGITMYRVGTVKTIQGVRTYVAVDGGMSDNIRTALYGAQYEALMPERMHDDYPHVVTITGKHCEQGDIVARDVQVPDDIAPGDLLCTPVTGAYGYSMASNYNKVPRPAVVFVRNGESRIVIRRETVLDVMRLDT
jgi:diaminopimelate decarboxylase